MKELLPLCGFMLVMITSPAVTAHNDKMFRNLNSMEQLQLALELAAQQELNAETMASKQLKISKSAKHENVMGIYYCNTPIIILIIVQIYIATSVCACA